MTNLEIRGYSERGMINTLFHEMKYSPNGIDLLRDFLQLCEFPGMVTKPDFDRFSGAKIRIEQSFSDFGDLDVLILVEDEPKQAIFIEAKVKTYQSRHWSIQSHWDAFTQFSPRQILTSNLFVQIYRKMRLVEKVRSSAGSLVPNIVSRRWSLGENDIVKKAAIELAPYCDQVWFVALVPGPTIGLQNFFSDVGKEPAPHNLEGWDTSRWGYLSWEDLEAHCRRNVMDWPETCASFDYNQGQIFNEGLPGNVGPNLPPPPGSAVTWLSPNGPELVAVKRRGTTNTRVVHKDGTTTRVPNAQLTWD